ncbi:hypothetical protein [Amycolatopsis sp. NPDC059021]|uniref:hypothetical protein n=1 Tax=Amycolatopsis sp. NPDC059021 TaxID=3346704 RepID=UPI00366E8648
MTLEDLSDIPALDPGDAFEEQCWGLLRRKYKVEEIQYLPADMGGDCGIEGYSTDGVVYQCYADRDSLSLRARTDKQKDKLYTDTEKLRKYKDRLLSVLDGLKVKHYFLMVPEFHAVELVAYANKRAKTVREYNLPFIDEKFAIRIKTPKDYPAELSAALRDNLAKAVVPDPVVEDVDVQVFHDETPKLVENMDTKLAVLKGYDPSANTVSLRNKLIKAFLAKEQIMEGLKEWPGTWEAVEVRRRLRQDGLELENELDSSAPSQRLMKLIGDYGLDLEDKVGGISEIDAKKLSMGQAGEWLLRCPLRFRKAQ